MKEDNIEEPLPDLKNDIQLIFNLFKKDNNLITKLKLRTMLFSFAMYKSAPSDINRYIEENTSENQENFSFDEVCKLINFKIKSAKEKEADELFNSLVEHGKCDINDVMLKKAFDDNQISITNKEIKEMMNFMGADCIEGNEDLGEDYKSLRHSSKSKIVAKDDDKNVPDKPSYVVGKELFSKFYVDNK